MRHLHFVAALTSLIPASLASQAPPAPATNPNPVEVIGQRPPKPKIICERFVPTGSIRPQKICATEAEFNDVRKQSLIELQRLRDRQQRNWQMRTTCSMVAKGENGVSAC